MNEALGAVAKIGFGTAMKNKWLSMDASKTVTVKVDSVDDEIQKLLQTLEQKGGAVDALEKKQLDQLTKRKLIKKESTTVYDVRKGPKFTLDVKKAQVDLTMDMILTGSWKDTTFKPYVPNELPKSTKSVENRQFFLHKICQNL